MPRCHIWPTPACRPCNITQTCCVATTSPGNDSPKPQTPKRNQPVQEIHNPDRTPRRTQQSRSTVSSQSHPARRNILVPTEFTDSRCPRRKVLPSVEIFRSRSHHRQVARKCSDNRSPTEWFDHRKLSMPVTAQACFEVPRHWPLEFRTSPMASFNTRATIPLLLRRREVFLCSQQANHFKRTDNLGNLRRLW